jgi:hypothetical protein
LNEQDPAGFNGASVGRVTVFRGEGRLGEGLTASKDVNDLFSTGSIYAMDVNGADLHRVKAVGFITFAEEVVPFFE